MRSCALRRVASVVLVIDGRRTGPAEVKVLPSKREANDTTLIVTVREGRNRQVRKMCDAIGHPVDHLKRVAIGPIRDAKLKVGRWRELSKEEVERLRAAAAETLRRGGRGGKAV